MQTTKLLIDFLFYLNKQKLINNHDFEYEHQAKKFLAKQKKDLRLKKPF